MINTSNKFPIEDPGVKIVVSGPLRNLLKGSALNPYFASPFGDMMMTGCYGHLAAIGDLLPEFSDVIKISPCGMTGRVARSPCSWNNQYFNYA